MAGVDVGSSGHASDHQTQIEVKFTTKLKEPHIVSTEGSIVCIIVIHDTDKPVLCD